MLGAYGSMRSGGRKQDVVVRENHEIISLYREAPTEELSLDEFELFSLDRLMILRKVDDLKLRGFKGAEFRMNLSKAVDQYMRINSMSATLDETLRKDNISHFILRLAYCRTEDLRRWFINQESALFRFRLESLSFNSIIGFIKSNEIDFELVSPEEKQRKSSRLRTVAGKIASDFETTTFFKVPFAEAIDLIGNRLVYLEAGWAYVPIQRVITIIVANFRMNLSRSLTEAYAAFPSISSDSRLGPLLKTMSKQYSGGNYASVNNTNGTIQSSELNALSRQSMPLCMLNLHSSLRKEHKIKHTGRLQYGLFLKGAGLTMESALSFWQEEFTKIMTADQFTKQYAYNVRHMYGKEGKRTNYTPYSCMKIILGASPGTGEHHGCPYRHFDHGHLNALLSSLNINGESKSSIAELAKKGDYQIACRKHFSVMHEGVEKMNIQIDGVGNHPNTWFATSRQYYNVKKETAE